MKLSQWLKKRPMQEKLMVVVIAMLLIMIATRWAYTTHTAGEAFRQRFVPPDSLLTPKAAPRVAPAADSLPGK